MFDSFSLEGDDRGLLDLTRQIEKKDEEIKRLKEIEQAHQKLNGQLRKEIRKLKEVNKMLLNYP